MPGVLLAVPPRRPTRARRWSSGLEHLLFDARDPAGRRRRRRALAELEVRAWRWAYVDVVAEEDMITVTSGPSAGRDGCRRRRWAPTVDRRIVASAAIAGDAHGRARRAARPLRRARRPGRRPGQRLLHDHAIAALRAAGFTVAVLWVFDGQRPRPRLLRAPRLGAGRARPASADRGARAPLPAESGVMTIRPVAARDVHAIAELQVRAWRAEHDGFVDEDAHADRSRTASALWNGVRPGEAWLARGRRRRDRRRRRRHQRRGRRPARRPEPLADEPRPSRRPAAATHAEDIMRAAGHTTALLWTFLGNQHNRALYERHGWDARRRWRRRRCPASPRSATAACCRRRHAGRGDRSRRRALPPAGGGHAGRQAGDRRPAWRARSAAGRGGDEPPPGATAARGSVYVTRPHRPLAGLRLPARAATSWSS